MEKVTLAMPIYNVEDYVESALLSALNQTYENIEFILVDDKGNDRSMEIVQQIIESHPRGKDVRIIDHVVNRGTGATKNSAIDAATGEYLFFMDSDDEITLDCIDIHYRAIKESGAEISAGGINNVDINNNVSPSPYYNTSELFIFKDSDKTGALFEIINYAVPTWNKLYKLSFLRDNNIRCVDNHLNEDELFSCQVKVNAESVVFIPNITYSYYSRDESTTANRRSSKFYNRYCVEIYDYVKYLLSCAEKSENPTLSKNIIRALYKKYIWLNINIKIDKIQIDDNAKEILMKIYKSLQGGEAYDKIRAHTITYHNYNVYRFVDRRLKSYQKRVCKLKKLLALTTIAIIPIFSNV